MCVLAAVGVAASGCADDTEAPNAPAANSTAASSAASTPATPASTATVYRRVDALCPKLDLAAVIDVLGPVGNPQDHSRAMGNTASLACTVTVGRLPNGVVLTVRADIGAPGSGKLMYEGLRQAQQSSGPVTDLTGVGSAAYTYTDESTGFNVVAYEANLYLTIAAAPLRPGATLPGDLPARVTAVAASALAALRT